MDPEAMEKEMIIERWVWSIGRVWFVALTVFLIGGCAILKGSYHWHEHAIVEWKDFRGKVPKHSPHAAISSTGIHYEWSYQPNSSVKIDIYSQFDRRNSWIKKDEKRAELLSHEQLHYDISELFARRFRKAVLSDEQFSTSSFKKQLRQYYSEFSKEMRVYQDLYDDETAHSVNKEKQVEWEQKVKRELEELNEYSDPVIIIE